LTSYWRGALAGITAGEVADVPISQVRHRGTF
jgi:hypothetical protein